jgi:hypothetical protein
MAGLDHASVRLQAGSCGASKALLLTVFVARRADRSGRSGSRHGSRLLLDEGCPAAMTGLVDHV